MQQRLNMGNMNNNNNTMNNNNTNRDCCNGYKCKLDKAKCIPTDESDGK